MVLTSLWLWRSGCSDPCIGNSNYSIDLIVSDNSVVPGEAGSLRGSQSIEFRDVPPKSKVGKLLRRELCAEERRKLQAS